MIVPFVYLGDWRGGFRRALLPQRCGHCQNAEERSAEPDPGYFEEPRRVAQREASRGPKALRGSEVNSAPSVSTLFNRRFDLLEDLLRSTLEDPTEQFL